MKHLYFVRHGESEMNVAELASGHIDTPLTDKGIAQADIAGLSIKDRKIVFDRIFSSPLKRAHHTAKGIVKHLDYDEDSIELLDMLKERHFGDLEGKSMAKDFGITLDMYFEDEKSLDHINGVEKAEEIYARAKETLQYLKSLPEDTILIVAHGSFGRFLYKAANGLPYDAKVPRIQNAEIIKLI